MPQEFLASFAVDIDESGVNRLQSILSQNRDLAAGLSAAFDSARSSMLDFIQSATEDLSNLPFFSPGSSVEEAFGTTGTFSVDLDFTRATKQLESFMAAAKKQMRLSADASGIVSAASAALSQARSMYAGANLTLKVKVEKEEAEAGDNTGSSSSSPRSALSGIAVPLATGGRFSSPTHAEIAEDGDPEYVVPVKKEQEAIPLVRSLLSELSVSARESLRDALPAAPVKRSEQGERSFTSASDTRTYEPLNASAPAFSDPAPISGLADLLFALPEMLFASTRESLRDALPEGNIESGSSVSNIRMNEPLIASAPDISDPVPLSCLADLLFTLPEMFSAAPAAAAPVVVSSAPPGNISAPVNIHVEAAAADPEAVGRSIYDTAERYLLRTLADLSTL